MVNHPSTILQHRSTIQLQDSVLEISGEPLDLLWFQARLASLGSTPLQVQPPATFAARNSWGLPWLHFASHLPDVSVELCRQPSLPLAEALRRNDFEEANKLLIQMA